MAKKLVFGALLLAVLAAGAGYLAGASRLSTDPVVSDSESNPAARVAFDDYEELLEKYQETRAELGRIRKEHERLVADHRAKRESERAAAAAAKEEDPNPEILTESGIDWQRFQVAFAKDVDLLSNIFRGANDPQGGSGRERMTPEEQARMMKLFTEYMTVAQEARKISPQPFFDDRIFPELVDSLFSESLGLDDEGREDLIAMSREVLSRNTSDLDPEDSLPIELLRARKAMIHDLDDGMLNQLAPERKERWSEVHQTATELMLGNMTTVHVGIQPGGDRTAYEDEILKRWKDAYGLNEAQAEQARSAASRFLDRARSLLERHGAAHPDKTLSPAEEYRLEQAMLTEQIRAEQSFQELLDPAQIAALAGRIPVAIDLHYGEKTDLSRRRGLGF